MAYRKYGRPHNKRRNNNRRRSFRGRRRVRSFDPTYLISKKTQQPKLEVVPIENAFNDFNVNQKIKINIQHKGYSDPTPIQDKTIPLILKGGDVVGVANTGTGKTAAFLIPLIDKAYKDRVEKVLIITPTRELAVQIQDEFISLAKGLKIYSALCIGGASINRQASQLRQRPQFVVGTPGRLKDLEQRRILNLTKFTTIVLDEVDRMLDMGFIHDVQHLISFFPQQRQSLFFSATIEGKVNQVMARFLNNPSIVSVKTRIVTDNIDQKIVKINRRNKIDVLHDLLIQQGFDKVLVFGRTKWGMEKLKSTLIDRGFKAASIHGNKTQNQRQRALGRFKKGEVKILLATDVAQRGLDINNVTHVINYDLPETKQDYIHRIGRTARADKKGVAITLLP
ncbi:MAG: DEAD/DEAH box helicase [Patescibacteria group bacterium]|nr:DEAD/DEAH box helicase [Patescibacteria group bacterium]